MTQSTLMLWRAIKTHPRYGANRQIDWMMVGAKVSILATIVFSPESKELAATHNLGFRFVAVMMSMAIATRVPAIILDVRWPTVGVWIRFCSSLLGAWVWGELAISIIAVDAKNGNLSLGFIYPWLAFGEVMSCYRAAADARY